MASSQLIADDFCKTYEFDAKVELAELNDETVDALLGMAPFGMGNPPPLLVARQVELAAPAEVFAERHLRLKFRNNGRMLAMKAWDIASRASQVKPGDKLDIAFVVEDDPYSKARGYSHWSATIKDFRT